MGSEWPPHAVSHTVGNRPRERPHELLRAWQLPFPLSSDQPDSSEGRTVTLFSV